MPESFGHNYDYNEGNKELVTKSEVSQEQALLVGESTHNKLQQIRELEENENKLEEVMSSLYDGLGLDEVLENNDDIHKFAKGVVDGLIVENVELVAELIESGIDELLNMLQSLLDPEVIWEIIKSIAEDLGDILDTFNQPYEGGKAIGGLGLGVVGKSFKGIKIVGKIKNKETSNNHTQEMNKETNNGPDNIPNNLYDNPNYSFLREYRDILGDVDINDVVGEGDNAIILKHPDKSKVIKIAKPGNVDKLDGEYKNHRSFYNKLRELKKSNEYPGLENIYIPSIEQFDNASGIYIMERVGGHSFKTRVTIDYHKDSLKDLPSGYFDDMTDNEIDLYLRKRGLRTNPRNTDEDNEMWGNREDREFLVDVERMGENKVRDEVKSILRIFEDMGYKHGDSHRGNFMQTKDGKIYMIDFGRSKITGN